MRAPRLPVRYLGWMARDVALGPGLVYLVIAALFAFLASQGEGPATAEAARRALQQIVSQFAWIVVLVGTAAIVSGDVSRGFYRALFSEPVSPAGYYLQRWLVGGAAVAAFVPLVGLGLLATTGFFPFQAAVLVRLLLLYLLLGGMVFLLSTVLRADWLIGLLLFILQTVLNEVTKGGTTGHWMTRFLAEVLPPFHLGSLARPGLPAGPELAHALLYGGAMVAAGVVILTARPMGSGGRA